MMERLGISKLRRRRQQTSLRAYIQTPARDLKLCSSVYPGYCRYATSAGLPICVSVRKSKCGLSVSRWWWTAMRFECNPRMLVRCTLRERRCRRCLMLLFFLFVIDVVKRRIGREMAVVRGATSIDSDDSHRNHTDGRLDRRLRGRPNPPGNRHRVLSPVANRHDGGHPWIFR